MSYVVRFNEASGSSKKIKLDLLKGKDKDPDSSKSSEEETKEKNASDSPERDGTTSNSDVSEAESVEIPPFTPPADGKYYGKSLVIKVFQDMTHKLETDTVSLWGQTRQQVKQEFEAHCKAKATFIKDKPRWTIPQTSIVERGKLKKSTIISMSRVESPAHGYLYIHTPTNFITKDSDFLTNIPSAEGDTKVPESVVTDFSKGLVELYEGNLHASRTQKLINRLPSNINVLDYIRVLMLIEREYFPVIWSETMGAKGKRKAIRKPTQMDLDKVYKMVPTIDPLVGKRELSQQLIEILTQTTLKMVTPTELQTCYTMLAEKRNSRLAPEPDLKPNLDAKENVTLTNKETTSSYYSLFCRLCYVFNCPKHPLILPDNEIKILHETAAQERAKRAFLKGHKAECHFEDCFKQSAGTPTEGSLKLNLSKIDEKTKKKMLAEWTPTERTMFNRLYESYKDYCIVATLLLNKTCTQTMQYHLVLKESEELISPDSTTTSSGYESASPPKPPSPKKKSAPMEQDLLELYTFQPCIHEGACDSNCPCVNKKLPCEVACGCSRSCKNRKKGCNCSTTCDSTRCPCFIALRECDPDICTKCGAHEIDLSKISCKNIGIQRNLGKEIEVKKSGVSGLGAFAKTDIKNGEFIREYTGEIISHNEAERRGHVYDFKQCTYLFGIQDNITIDATRYGNETRFINSSKRPNCTPRKMSVRGEIRVGLFACKNIKKGDELSFDYSGVLRDHKKQYEEKTKKPTKAKKKVEAASKEK